MCLAVFFWVELCLLLLLFGRGCLTMGCLRNGGLLVCLIAVDE